MAAIGAAAAIRLRRLESGYFALAGTVLIALMLPLSLPIWEGLPFLAFIQFPWRLLGPTAFCLAILAAGALDWLPKENAWLRAAPLALPLLLALPVFVPPGWGDFGPTDRLAMLNFELNGLALGTTSTGDFVPAGVDVVPGPQPTMIAAYEQGGPVDRVNRATLPPGATVDLLGQRTISHRYRVTSSEDFTLRLYLFDFAGWRASIDGQPVPIETASPEGWITVPVPAGSHEVRVWLGTTPARTLTTLISVAGAAGLAFAAWRLPASARSERAAPGNRAQAAAVLGGTMLLMAISGAAGWFQVRSTGVVAEPAEVDTRAYLAGGLDLIGYAIGQQPVRPGESLPVTHYWKAREPVPANYQVFVHLTTSADTTCAQSDKLNPGDYPTTRWPLDRYLRDPHAVAIPTGTPPGTYQLRIGLWLRDSGRRNLVLAEDGTILGDTVLLAMPVTVEPARGPVDVPVPAIRVDSEIQPGIRLVGANLTPGTSFDAPLGQLAVDLVWLSNRGDLPAYGTWLRLVAPDGTVVAQAHRSTDEKQYPTPLWTDGEVVREVMGLWIGEDVTPGTYRLEVALSEDTPSAWHPVTLIERSLP
ncbi:MAG: hypothetical protein ACFB51_04305 [Anaerolineae bacterium]